VEPAVTNPEADRRLLAASINGLIGAVGKQVRMQMPENIDKALYMAIIATNAEKEKKASVRQDRGTSARVFRVGGSRGGIPGNRYDNRYWKPRGNLQSSSNRGCLVAAQGCADTILDRSKRDLLSPD